MRTLVYWLCVDSTQRMARVSHAKLSQCRQLIADLFSCETLRLCHSGGQSLSPSLWRAPVLLFDALFLRCADTARPGNWYTAKCRLCPEIFFTLGMVLVLYDDPAVNHRR